MATDEVATVDSSDFIGQGSSGKYLLLKIPSYESSGASLYQDEKDTYLNLGRGMGQSATDSPAWPAQTGGQPSWTASGLNENAVAPPARSGEDLLSFFGGFTDDKRLRETGGSFNAHGTPPNESAARGTAAAFSSPTATSSTSGEGRNLKVTELIPDYVGWRDHTDGHRISTTRGDKIEIIGGNYKLVTLGRGTGVATYEQSGGITVGSDETPGNTTSVTWRDVPTVSGEKGWKVVEQVVKGNTVERFHGTKREEFYGDKLISVVGAPNEPTSNLSVASQADNGNPETYVGDSSAYTSTKNVATFGGEALDSYAYPTKWDLEDDVPPKLQQPDVYESRWAKSMNAYTYCAGDSNSQQHFIGKHKERNIYEGGHHTETTMHTVGKYFQETWHFMGSGGFMERFEGSFLQFFLGSSTTIGLANRFELYVSTEEQLNLGFIASLSLGGKLDGSWPQKWQFDLNEEKVTLNGNEVGLKEVAAHLQAQEARIDEAKAILSARGCGLTKNTRHLMRQL